MRLHGSPETTPVLQTEAGVEPKRIRAGHEIASVASGFAVVLPSP